MGIHGIYKDIVYHLYAHMFLNIGNISISTSMIYGDVIYIYISGIPRVYCYDHCILCIYIPIYTLDQLIDIHIYIHGDTLEYNMGMDQDISNIVM